MNAWDTVLGQRALESINSIAQDVDKISRNYPTLRDQFAMACLTSGCSFGTSRLYVQPGVSTEEAVARFCYRVADAMLAERSKEN